MLLRRLAIVLVVSGLAVTAGSAAVVVATVFMTPERPRPPTPTALVIQASRPTGTPHGAGPSIPTPAATPMATPAPPTSTPVTLSATATTAPAATVLPTRAPALLTPPPAKPAPTATPRPAPSPTAIATRPPAPTATSSPSPVRPLTPAPAPSRPPATATATQPPRPAPLVLTTARLMLTPGQKAAVGISYTGSGQIDWQASADVPWLSVTPASGTLRGETDVLTIEARPGDLGAGVYQGRVIVTAGGGQAIVQVTLRIGRP